MKFWFKSLIIFFLLLVFSNSAFCYVLSKEEIQKIILNRVQNEYKKELSSYSSDFKIEIQGIPNEKIISNETAPLKIQLISQQDGFSPNSYRKVIVRNSKGQILKSFAINVQTKVYSNVLVASKPIGFNQEINSTNTKIERKEITRNLENSFSSLPNNVVSNRNFPQGSIILKEGLKKKALISKNSMVDIKFQSKTLEIKTRGHALKDGSLGDVILVKSDKYNKTYNAIVQSSNEVVVRI